MAIKLIISDFDGTLLDLKLIHYEALNSALPTEKQISFEDHISTYDGLSTRKKLELLNIPMEMREGIEKLKQEYTLNGLEDFGDFNKEITEAVKKLSKEYTFCVASNARRETVELGLKKLGLDVFSLTNEDVDYSKPNPEIYLTIMANQGMSPAETLIIEDSKTGLEAATKSGAHVYAVDSSWDFDYDKIKNSIKTCESKPVKWSGKSNMTVLIPMAGAGSRFKEKGYSLPKPLIDVNGKPMIQRVVENLNIDANYVFVVQKEHYDNYLLSYLLPLISPGCKIVTVDGMTEGAACTTLLAKEFIDNDNHLLIANSDQLVDWDSADFCYSMIAQNLDGGILTFKDTNPKWSFVKTDQNGYVTDVAEKNPISDVATVGIYYFKRGREYVKYAEQRIAKNIRFKGEFYIAPTYEEMIQDGKKIKAKNCAKMFGLGVPEDLEAYLNG